MNLCILDLVCRYDAMPALECVTFDVDTGGFVGIVGPNGAGKTTLMRAINGLMRPAGGAVYLNGQDVQALDTRSVARQVAAVPQEGRAAAGFTAWEIVLMGRTPHLGHWESEGEEDRRIAREAMERTRTWALAARMFDNLSGGERQRVLIARALCQQPRLLLLDEPTLHLDVRSQLEVMELLHTLNQQGLTVVAALHDLNLAALYCPRLIMLKEGRIFAAGTPREVLTVQTVHDVYDIEVTVQPHPTADTPVLILNRGPAV